jgi:hypothetical protein
VVGARIEQEGDTLLVDFAFDENHGFHRTEGHADGTKIRANGAGGEQKQQEQQREKDESEGNGFA